MVLLCGIIAQGCFIIIIVINVLFQGKFGLCLPNYFYFPQSSVVMLKNTIQHNWFQFVKDKTALTLPET